MLLKLKIFNNKRVFKSSTNFHIKHKTILIPTIYLTNLLLQIIAKEPSDFLVVKSTLLQRRGRAVMSTGWWRGCWRPQYWINCCYQMFLKAVFCLLRARGRCPCQLCQECNQCQAAFAFSGRIKKIYLPRSLF